MIYEITFTDINGQLQELHFNSKEEVLKWHNETFKYKAESFKEIFEDGEIHLKTYSENEFKILNGEIQKFKKGRKEIGYIKQSYKGFKFCTGKPSDVSCLSWNYKNYNDALFTANEFVNNYSRL